MQTPVDFRQDHLTAIADQRPQLRKFERRESIAASQFDRVLQSATDIDPWPYAKESKTALRTASSPTDLRVRPREPVRRPSLGRGTRDAGGSFTGVTVRDPIGRRRSIDFEHARLAPAAAPREEFRPRSSVPFTAPRYESAYADQDGRELRRAANSSRRAVVSQSPWRRPLSRYETADRFPQSTPAVTGTRDVLIRNPSAPVRNDSSSRSRPIGTRAFGLTGEFAERPIQSRNFR
ncbi:MAG: hypothetical protein IID45_07065 [Planctomycetes bacterium]|nr:hypothetical protein [Planctomycetota bacterium]